jgi:hypothetical protein
MQIKKNTNDEHRQLEERCYCCGKPGHKLPDCNKKDKIPQNEWAINQQRAGNAE